MKGTRVFVMIISFIIFTAADDPAYGFAHSAGGYLKNMQAFSFTDADSEWSMFNAWNLRLNARLFPSDNLTLVFGGNTFFIYSGSVVNITGQEKSGYYTRSDPGELSAGYISDSFTAGVFSDRMYFEFNKNIFSFSGGYQRINWGMNTVWNPNDIFNAYSIYDIDYEERPGILSLRARIFTGPASGFDIAAAPGEKYGILYRFNLKGRDIQLLCGYGGDDLIAAAGFESELFTAGIKGEYTHFYDTDSKTDGHIAAFNIIHTLKNGTGITAGFIHNSYGMEKNAFMNRTAPSSDDPVKSLSAGRYGAFWQLSHPFTPLLYGSTAAVMNLSDMSLYISPQLIYSMFEDLELLLAAQLYTGKGLDEFPNTLGRSVFIRLKYSF